MNVIVAITLSALMFSDTPAQEWRLKVISSDSALIYQVDGSDPAEAEFRESRGSQSPDGTLVAYVNTSDGDADIFVARADGTQERRLTRNDDIDNFPSWTADGKRLVFASARSGKWQVYSMNLDGNDVKQLTDHKIGAWWPSVGTKGQIAFLTKYLSRNKYRPVDLCLLSEGKHETLAQKIFITDFSWSPDGEMIAYGTENKLIFHRLKTGKKTEVSFDTIDRRLSSHGAYSITWRPDSLAVTCKISFLGGRAVGAEMFGDRELFVIPIGGKSSWFRPKEPFQRVEWVR